MNMTSLIDFLFTVHLASFFFNDYPKEVAVSPALPVGKERKKDTPLELGT